MSLRKTHCLLWLLLWGGALSTIYAQPSDKVQAIDQIFKKFYEYESFQGAVLVADQGDIIYRQAFGQANREWSVPNTTDTRFNIASLSKQFTAVLVLQLVDEGKLHLDSTISAYLPEYRSDIGRQVTVHQLLTHQSGIPNYTSLPYVWSDSLALRYATHDLIRKFGSRDLEFSPGTRFQYNNTGYLLLSAMAEAATGEPFDTLLTRRVLRPIHLQHTAVDDRSQLVEKRAYGYEKTTKGFHPVAGMYMTNLRGAGNLYSTVEDLYRWDQALYAHELLPKKWLKAMTKPHTEASASWLPPYENTYGYGVGIAEVPLTAKKTIPMIFHSGHIKGFSSFYARFPEGEQAVILLSNTGNVSTTRMNEITQEVVKVLHGLPYTLPQRDLAADLYQVIQQEGIEAAVAHYHYLRDAFPYEFQDSAEKLDALGQRLQGEGAITHATIIFQLNTDVNPHWLTFYRLADACAQLGETENAQQYYERSLSLNPKRTSPEKSTYRQAKDALKRIRKSMRASANP